MNASFFAQETLKKSIFTDASNYIFEFDIIDHIEIIESNNPKIITVLSEGSDTQSLNFNLTEVNGDVYLKNVDTEFLSEKEKINKVCKVQPIYTSFTIEVPKGKNIFVTFTDGNFYLNQFQGNLELLLNDGLVEVNQFSGSILVKIEGGNVICTGIENTSIDVESNLGIVNSTLATAESQSRKNKVNAIYGSPINILKVRGISANVYLK